MVLSKSLIQETQREVLLSNTLYPQYQTLIKATVYRNELLLKTHFWKTFFVAVVTKHVHSNALWEQVLIKSRRGAENS